MKAIDIGRFFFTDIYINCLIHKYSNIWDNASLTLNLFLESYPCAILTEFPHKGDWVNYGCSSWFGITSSNFYWHCAKELSRKSKEDCLTPSRLPGNAKIAFFTRHSWHTYTISLPVLLNDSRHKVETWHDNSPYYLPCHGATRKLICLSQGGVFQAN